MLQLIETLAIIPNAFLLLIILIQIWLISLKGESSYKPVKPSLSVLIPAHNEEKSIAKTLDSVFDSGYPGRMEIIVIDDGSGDKTPEILRKYSKRKLARVLRTNHAGKANSLNRALAIAKNDVIVTLDADCIIQKGSLETLVKPFSDSRVAATSGARKVANPKKLLAWFQRIEYAYLALYKGLCDKVGGTIWTSGTLSAFRSSQLKKAGGFDSTTFSEDIDVALRLMRKGLKIRFVPEAVSWTYVPEKMQGFFSQRIRWSRGIIQISKRYRGLYFRRKNPGSGFISLPIMSYWYFHSVAIIFIISLQIILGYYQYFFLNGSGFSPGAALYFFYWFSVFGIINLAYQMIAGNYAVTLLSVLSVLIVALNYSILVYSLRWSKERIGAKGIIGLVFMFPYWIMLSMAQLISTPEWFRKTGKNVWNK